MASLSSSQIRAPHPFGGERRLINACRVCPLFIVSNISCLMSLQDLANFMREKKITTRLHKVGNVWKPYFTMSWFRLRRAEERNNMLGYIIRQQFFSEGLYTFFLWGFFIFFLYFFIFFFYVYFLYFFGLGGGSFMSHPFYVLFGAISRLAWKPLLRRESQPERIN